jgi:hypothetical protein
MHDDSISEKRRKLSINEFRVELRVDLRGELRGSLGGAY